MNKSLAMVGTWLLIAGCRASEPGPEKAESKESSLGRDEAASIINQSDKFQAHAFEWLLTGDDEQDLWDYGQDRDLQAALLKLGQLKKSPGVLEYQTRIDLTAKGKEVWKDQGEFEFNYPPSRVHRAGEPEYGGLIVNWLHVADREVAKVTGIAEAEKRGMREVQLDWRWALTEKGRELCGASNAIRDWYAEHRHAKALLRQYDDGWRVESLELE